MRCGSVAVLIALTVLTVLTVLTGVADAIAFLSLGGVSTCVMTGNMVLMGVGIGAGELA